MSEKKRISVMIPCYNEEACLPNSFNAISETFNNFVEEEFISKDSRLVFVDDGSKDKTWSIIKELSNKDLLLDLNEIQSNLS